MQPIRHIVALTLLFVPSAASAHDPCAAREPLPEDGAAKEVRLELSGLDVEVALGLLARGSDDEVMIGDLARKDEAGVVVVHALRCGASGCDVARARFLVDPRAERPRLLGCRAAPVALQVALEAGGRPTPLLTVADDGIWIAPTASGRLTADENAQLRSRIDAARLVAERGPPCPARPEHTVVTTARGSVRYANGCGLQPDPSVRALVELAESLTTRRPDPVLFKLRRARVGADDLAETVALMRTGAWTTHRGRGTLDAATLAGVIAALDAALIEAPPIPDVAVCRGDFPHHIEVPGRGELRFIWPCHRPSPSLQLALDRIYAAVGLRAP